MVLSRDEMALLIAVSVAEEERKWERFESIMGTSWDIYDLIGVIEREEKKKDPDAKPAPIEIPRRVRIPLLLGAAPDFFKHLMDGYKDKYKAMMEAMGNSGGGQLVELGTLSPDQARDLYQQIGRQVAGAKPPAPDEPKD